MAIKSLGQHFLKNASAIQKIVDALELAPGDTVIEIGAGHGEMTLQLTQGTGDKGHVIAIEKDERLFRQLEHLANGSLKLIHGDALKLLPATISQLPNHPLADYKLVGNIPYYITGHLLRIVSDIPWSNMPERCVFTVQKEVAERIVAKAPKMNRLAASVAYWADAKIIAILPKEDFAPQPKVASAIILLARKAEPASKDANHYYEAVRTLFAQPRKTVLNNLAQHDAGFEATKEAVSLKLHSLSIDPGSRPQDLSVEIIAAIAEKFF